MVRKIGSQYLEKMKSIEAELKNNYWIKAVKFDREYQFSDIIIGSSWSRYARQNVGKFNFTIEKKFDKIYFVSKENNAQELFRKEFDERGKRPVKKKEDEIGQHEKSVTELMEIPGVGKLIADDLYSIGIRSIEDLKGKNPEELVKKIHKNSSSFDVKKLLYVVKCCVYYASTEKEKREPEKLKWWYWKNAE